MPVPLRPAVAVVVLLAALLLASCSGADPGEEGGGKKGVDVTLAPGTCWTADRLGEDPQDVLQLSSTYGVDYFAAANALADRPAFALTEACGGGHHVEVYRTVPVSSVAPVVTGYATLLQPSSAAYQQVAARVQNACMGRSLQAAAKLTKLAGAVAEPAFPDGVDLTWAPPSPDQWARGQRVYACILTSDTPVRFRYGAVFTTSFPTSLRTCIDSKALVYVDCARKHDRERIAVIDVRAAVAAGAFPGRKAIKPSPDGSYVDVPPATLALLDKACTSYLKSVSTTKKLTGIAEIDPDRWPAPDGSYPVDCEASVAPTKKPVITTGSVYNKR